MSVPVLQKLGSYGQNGLRTPIRGSEVGELLKDYRNLADLLPSTNTPAICEPLNSERTPLTHQRLKTFIQNEFDLVKFGIPWSRRVAILLPNGAELAVALLAVTSHWCAAPINSTSTWQEIKLELMSTRAVAIMILSGASTNEAALKAAAELGVGVITITPLGLISGLFRMTSLTPVEISAFPPTIDNRKLPANFKTYNHPETILLLHTSGTSGNKKLVPYSLDMVIVGVGSIIASWSLTPNDVCLNMMPLFHIGGIVRNVFSPILSGGAVITCTGFDPLLFWDVLYASNDRSQSNSQNKVPRPTWYYAAPTMHHAILNEGERRPLPLPIDSIRFIANAAGGLLPILAKRLRDTFHAVILTSYGMTECMPISTPPQSYALNPTGTSGTAVGPDIIIVDDEHNPVANGVKGNIFVRGPPCFGGYEYHHNDDTRNGTAAVTVKAEEQVFFQVSGQGDGWFNTGDMGCLDNNGYLFIQGRSKEIINRGGETISPFEIEEAIQQHPFVKEVLAFSAPHDQYQETVGVLIVTKAYQPKVDLPSLHHFLETRLHRSKWPCVIVFAESLPKNNANKTLRIRYAERVGLRSVDEESPPSTRLFLADSPPIGTALTVPIAITPVTVDLSITKSFILTLQGIDAVHVIIVDLPSQQEAIVAFVQFNSKFFTDDKKKDEEIYLGTIKRRCDEKLDAFNSPLFIYRMPRSTATAAVTATAAASALTIEDDEGGSGGSSMIDEEYLRQQAIINYQQTNIIRPRNTIESQIELIWRSLLGCPTMLSVTASFFDLGGDSLKAGQVIGAMRQQLRVPLSVADLFTAPSIEAMAVKIATSKSIGSPHITSSSSLPSSLSPNSTLMIKNEKRRATATRFQTSLSSIEEERQSQLHREFLTWEFSPPYSNTSFWCLFIQAMPIAVIYPLRRIIIWFLIAGPWVMLMSAGHSRFLSLLIAMLTARVILGIGAPLIGILAKWVIIGRYTAGRYPLWGAMYLKWWIVEQIISIMGKGYFRDDLPIIGPHLVRLYYILMGANIGINVKIHKDAKIGQADLLTIHDNVAIDNCTIRAFSIEEGHFVLLPITIGKGASIGVKSVVAAGAIIPDHTAIGPLSSSHESEQDADPINRSYCRPTYAPPSSFLILFVGVPILLTVLTISFIPWFIVLKSMAIDAKDNGWYAKDLHSVYLAFLWWITPQRLFYFFILRIVKRCVIPFLKLTLILLIKWTIIGKFTVLTEREKNTDWNRFRYWLMAKLLPGGGLVGVAKLVGTHYEIISIIYRLLGAKIGKRVYWPGSGLEIVEFDLLEVGDDVVFGSRSVVMTSSSTASKKIILEAGCMVADRCVLLPGSIVRRGAVLGSGALAAEDMEIPIGSVWLGSQAGRALNVAPPDKTYAAKETISPFGNAFYNNKAAFTVIPLWMIVVYNTLWQAFCTCYRNCPTALSLIICSHLLQFDPFDNHSPASLFRVTFIAFSPLYLALCCSALCIDILGKWLLLGRRMPGEYPWDQSSYCQRWQVYLTLQEIRRGERHKTGILDMIQGSQYLVWYFRALGATIGNNVCLYPNGGDPMFTEPDLVTVGDFCSIDDASVIAHINTRGVFRLNKMSIGTGSILKSMSRLLSGASMEAHTILLEHTLVLAGEKVEAGSVWQGWPSRSQSSLKEHRLMITQQLEEVNQRHVAMLRANSSSLLALQESNGSSGSATTRRSGYSAVEMNEVDDDPEAGHANNGTKKKQMRMNTVARSSTEGERQPLLKTRSKDY